MALRPSSRIATHGLTLPELLAATAITGILAAIALSVAGGTLHASRAADARSALLQTYATALRHSSTRGLHVVACPASTAGACRDSIDWSGGWILFEDRDRDRERNESERIVTSFPPLAAKVHLRGSVGRKRLVFQPSGGNAGSNATLTLCDGRGAESAIQLVLANDGRLRESPAGPVAAAACMEPSD